MRCQFPLRRILLAVRCRPWRIIPVRKVHVCVFILKSLFISCSCAHGEFISVLLDVMDLGQSVSLEFATTQFLSDTMAHGVTQKNNPAGPVRSGPIRCTRAPCANRGVRRFRSAHDWIQCRLLLPHHSLNNVGDVDVTGDNHRVWRTLTLGSCVVWKGNRVAGVSLKEKSARTDCTNSVQGFFSRLSHLRCR